MIKGATIKNKTRLWIHGEIVRLYKAGMTAAQIEAEMAGYIGANRFTIYEILKRKGIPRRNRAHYRGEVCVKCGRPRIKDRRLCLEHARERTRGPARERYRMLNPMAKRRRKEEVASHGS